MPLFPSRNITENFSDERTHKLTVEKLSGLCDPDSPSPVHRWLPSIDYVTTVIHCLCPLVHRGTSNTAIYMTHQKHTRHNIFTHQNCLRQWLFTSVLLTDISSNILRKWRQDKSSAGPSAASPQPAGLSSQLPSVSSCLLLLAVSTDCGTRLVSG